MAKTSEFRIIENLDDQVVSEINRIGAELLACPFVPRVVAFNSKPHVRRYVETTPCSLGAPVYHDIIAEGGVGSRRDVRIVLNMVLDKGNLKVPYEYATGCAVVSVARYRLFNPEKVSEPVLPDRASVTYRPEEFNLTDQDKLAKISAMMRAFASRLNFVKSVGGPRWQDNQVKKARLAWRLALEAVGDETPLMLAEQEELGRLTTALRAMRRAPVQKQTAMTRLITLDDLEDENFA